MEETQLKQMAEGWKKLSAPQIVEQINVYRHAFDEEEKAIRAQTGQTPFNSEVSYYKPLNALFNELNDRFMTGEEITLHYDTYSEPEPVDGVIHIDKIVVVPHTVQFTSDAHGHYHFDGNKVIVEYDREWAFKLRKGKSTTNAERPVDFYLDFLDPHSKYSLRHNVFGTTCKTICENIRRKRDEITTNKSERLWK